MQRKPDAPSLDKSVLLALMALFLFASPFTQWWSNAGFSWLLPFFLWLLIIILGALIARSDKGS